MKYLLFIISLFYVNPIIAQNKVMICKENQGCQEGILKIPNPQVDEILEKKNFFSNAAPSDILVLVDCISDREEKLSAQEVHQKYGGKGIPEKLPSFDLPNYILNKACIKCPNLTKKISFDLQADEESSKGFFYLNLKDGEAFMPDESYKMMYSDMENMTINSFFKDYQYINYTIDEEGGKWKTYMPIGTSVSLFYNDQNNASNFSKNFKESGNKKIFLNTKFEAVEYKGTCSDGPCTLWLVPSRDVCLKVGKFDALGFWNLGYINIDGSTFILTEISGNGFSVKITGYENGQYNFNSAGYLSF